MKATRHGFTLSLVAVVGAMDVSIVRDGAHELDLVSKNEYDSSKNHTPARKKGFAGPLRGPANPCPEDTTSITSIDCGLAKVILTFLKFAPRTHEF